MLEGFGQTLGGEPPESSVSSAAVAQILREEILTYSSSREEFDDELAYLSRFLDKTP